MNDWYARIVPKKRTVVADENGWYRIVLDQNLVGRYRTAYDELAQGTYARIIVLKIMGRSRFLHRERAWQLFYTGNSVHTYN